MNSTFQKSTRAAFGASPIEWIKSAIWKRRTLSPSELVAKDQGFAAWQNNVHENPYPPKSALHAAWAAGQDDAMTWEMSAW